MPQDQERISDAAQNQEGIHRINLTAAIDISQKAKIRCWRRPRSRFRRWGRDRCASCPARLRRVQWQRRWRAGPNCAARPAWGRQLRQESGEKYRRPAVLAALGRIERPPGVTRVPMVGQAPTSMPPAYWHSRGSIPLYSRTSATFKKLLSSRSKRLGWKASTADGIFPL